MRHRTAFVTFQLTIALYAEPVLEATPTLPRSVKLPQFMVVEVAKPIPLFWDPNELTL